MFPWRSATWRGAPWAEVQAICFASWPRPKTSTSARPPPREAPAGGGRIQREDGAVSERADRGKRRRHHAEIVQADVDPGRADAEEAGAKSEARPERCPRRRRALPDEQQGGESEEREREQRRRSEGGDGQGAPGQSRGERRGRRLQEGLQAWPGARCT